MATGTYQGTVTLTNSSNSADVTTIPVTLAVNGGGGGTGTGGSIAPTSLTFNYQVGTGSPAYQEILVPVAGTYTVQTTGAFVSTSGTTLTVPSGQVGTLLVLPAVVGFAPGSYPGSVTLTSTTGISQTV